MTAFSLSLGRLIEKLGSGHEDATDFGDGDLIPGRMIRKNDLSQGHRIGRLSGKNLPWSYYLRNISPDDVERSNRIRTPKDRKMDGGADLTMDAGGHIVHIMNLDSIDRCDSVSLKQS